MLTVEGVYGRCHINKGPKSNDSMFTKQTMKIYKPSFDIVMLDLQTSKNVFRLVILVSVKWKILRIRIHNIHIMN